VKSKPLFRTALAGIPILCQERRVDSQAAGTDNRADLRRRRHGWLRTVPGIGRLRALRPGADAHVGALVDAFAAFATLDDVLSSLEADLILDMISLISRGTQERLVPVLMTALSAGIALIPLVLAPGDPGKEILHPVAVAIVGGLVSSTLLDLVVTPAVFLLTGRRAAEKALGLDAPAAR
jgi:hypothetical protein